MEWIRKFREVKKNCTTPEEIVKQFDNYIIRVEMREKKQKKAWRDR